MRRQCWVPTFEQFDILQCIFDGGNRCPKNAEIIQINNYRHIIIFLKNKNVIGLRIGGLNKKESKCVHKQRMFNRKIL